MTSLHPGSSPEHTEELRRSLDHIAALIEARNHLAEQAGSSEGDGADKAKKDDQGKDKRGGVKKFFSSPLGIVLSLVALALLVTGGIFVWRYEKTHVNSIDAYTAGRRHRVGPRVNGTVVEVWVDDNQDVKKGDLLVKLDPRDYEVALEVAQARLEQSKAQELQARAAFSQAAAGVAQAQAQLGQAQAQVSQAGANFEIAGVDFGRNRALSTQGARAVSQANVDTSQSLVGGTEASFAGSKAKAQAAEAALQIALAARESRGAGLEAARAAVADAQAGDDNAKLQLSYCWVLAPCDGRVSKKTVETGQSLARGDNILDVTENVVWVVANYTEIQLTHIRVGQRVKIPVDTFPDHPFTGRVDSIQNGTGATYSLEPPDYAADNFAKIPQRVPVKLTFDPESIKGFESLVVLGLSCTPTIDLASTSDRGDHVAKDNPAPPRGKHQQ